MRNISTFFFLMNFFICSAQTFTLQELETYAEYNEDEFIRTVMAKGYELTEVKEDWFQFFYAASSVKNTYGITYFPQKETSENHFFVGVGYTTSYKESFISLENSIKSKGYEYISSKTSSGPYNSVGNFYQRKNLQLITRIGIDANGNPQYSVIIFSSFSYK